MYLFEITNFFGRFHPLLVHLPIGFLIISIILSAFNQVNNFSYTRVLRIIWFLSFISAFFSALMGWLLSQNGYYIEEQLFLHKLTGFILVFLSGLGWIFQFLNIPKFLKKFNNALILVFLIVVGHLGGNLTHGESYLFEYAPEPIKTVLISETKQKKFEEVPLDSIGVYKDLIHPIFLSKCIACHNNNIARGGLNMSTTTSLFKGGRSGPSIVANDLKKSLVFNRVTRSQDNNQFMPPTGIPLTYDEIKLLEWWINQGASLKTSLTDIKPDSKIQSLLFKNYSIDLRKKPWYELVKLPAIDESVFNELDKHNFSCKKLSSENSLLDIRYNGSQIQEKDLLTLEKYAPYITWLNLGESRLKDSHIKFISKMKNLTRLSLQKNNLKTDELKPLLNLDHLEILNLHSTKVDREIFELIENLKSLKKVFLWNTLVTSKEISNQNQKYEGIEIVGNLE